MDAIDREDLDTLVLAEGRYARLESIEWWDQRELSRARVLVVGAGALGNEVLKNLALLGVGHIVIIDMDKVEPSNLSRSVLFREADVGRAKAERAAHAVGGICAETRATPIVGTVQSDLGLGWFRWANLVVGAVDNREARVFINAACAQLGRPWIDGGIEVFQGIVRTFVPPRTACYECTMSAVDWDLIDRRRSCSLLAARATAAGGTPTTPIAASVIGALQAQEIVKFLHGMETLEGRGFVYEGRNHASYIVNYAIKPSCPWHESPAPVEPVETFSSETPLARVWEWASDRLGPLDAIDLSREIVGCLECPVCNRIENVFTCADALRSDQISCAHCDQERVPHYIHSISEDSELMSKNFADIGLPPWDIVWARTGNRVIGIEFSGDSGRLLGETNGEGRQ